MRLPPPPPLDPASCYLPSPAPFSSFSVQSPPSLPSYPSLSHPLSLPPPPLSPSPRLAFPPITSPPLNPLPPPQVKRLVNITINAVAAERPADFRKAFCAELRKPDVLSSAPPSKTYSKEDAEAAKAYLSEHQAESLLTDVLSTLAATLPGAPPEPPPPRPPSTASPPQTLNPVNRTP